MKHLITLVGLLMAIPLLAKDTELKVKSIIESVIVYEKSAQVERNAKYTLPVGTSHLVFNDLPHYLDINQVQFTGEGDFVIQSIFFTYRNDTINRAQLKAYVAPIDPTPQIVKLQQRDQNIVGKIAVYEKERTMLEANSHFKHSVEGMDIDRLTQASVFLRERHLDIHTVLFELNAERKQIQQEINDMQLVRGQAPYPVISRYLELNVKVTTKKQQACTFAITYQVADAGWTPTYDVNVDDITKPVELDYKAKVRQRSGEEWKDVELTLSTGTPQNNKAQPELSPWRIGQVVAPRPPAPLPVANVRHTNANSFLQSKAFNAQVREVSGQVLDVQGQPLPFVNVICIGKTNQGTTTDFEGRYRVAIPDGVSQLQYSFLGYQSLGLMVSQASMNVYLEESSVGLDAVLLSSERVSAKSIQLIPAMQVAGTSARFKKNRGRSKRYDVSYADVRMSYSPTSVKFTAQVPYDIPSDGQLYNVHLTKLNIPAEYMYACTPKLSDEVYLTARITDWESLDLLPGEAQVYFEGSYIGRSNIDPSFADDTLDLSLGADPGIRITRERVKAGSKKQLFAATRKDSREWSIDIRNAKKATITLIVEDQIPVSQSEDVQVKLVKSDGGKLDADNGIVTWRLKLDSGEKRKVNFKYEVEHPKDSYLSLE